MLMRSIDFGRVATDHGPEYLNTGILHTNFWNRTSIMFQAYNESIGNKESAVDATEITQRYVVSDTLRS